MSRTVQIVAAVALATAVVIVWRSTAGDVSCETTMDFDGVTYVAHEVTEEITAEGDLGVGLERGCGENARWRDEVAVSRIAGVDPRAALATPVAARVLYVAEGITIDELPSELAEIVAQ